MIEAERLIPAGAELAEGPVWSDADQRLGWVDITAGEVHRSRLDGSDAEIDGLAEPVGAIALTVAGSWIAAVADGLRPVVAGSERVAAIPTHRPDLRMNDGKADPAGRFVGGTMQLDPIEPVGSLWSIEGSRVRRLLDGVTISNGLDWSDDGSLFFYIDTPTQRIDVFDYDLATGAISERRTWAEIDPEHGAPDGLCLDAEGGVWVALWGGSAVHRYVDGRLDEVIGVPTPHVTCPTFAGPDLDLLVITTARQGFDEPPPGAGDLYVARPGVSGRQPNLLGPWAS